MTDRDDFGDRMKGYEAVSDTVLPARLPVIIRLDGNSFSRFTEEAGFAKPFDVRFEEAMDAAALAVAEYAGAVCAYVQSDEITLLLVNDRSRDETPFLGNRVQKLASLTAALAASAFTLALGGMVAAPVAFDSRVFVVPPSEVNNVFLWRQKDAFKNFVGSTLYYALRQRGATRGAATKAMLTLTTNARQERLFSEFGINVNDAPIARRRGRMLRRVKVERPIQEAMPPVVYDRLLAEGKVTPGQVVTRRQWQTDNAMPLLSDPTYLAALLAPPTASESP